MYISRLEMYIFRLEMCISRLEIEFIPCLGNFSRGFRNVFPYFFSFILRFSSEQMPIFVGHYNL